MPRYRSLDEIFDEPDEFGLLEIKERSRGSACTPDARNVEIVAQVNAFFEAHGRIPDAGSLDVEEMKLGTIWQQVRTSPSAAMMEADRNRLLGYGHQATPEPEDITAAAAPEPDWRDDPVEDDIPRSLDDIFDEDDDPVHEAVVAIRNVTPAAEREQPAHRADMYPCKDFETFSDGFEDMQAKLDAGDRLVQPVQDNVEIAVHEGDYFIHRGLLGTVT